jgi:outer membrane protein assembly factor BamA/autotransporter translocation and assembly factor TamB
VEVNGTLSLADISSALTSTAKTAPSGSIALTAMTRGPLSTPRVSFTLASDRVTWQHLTASALTANGVVDSNTMQIEAANLEMAGGMVETRGQLRFSPLQLIASAEWRDLSARMLAGPDAPANVSAVLTGGGRVDWTVPKGVSGVTAAINTESRPAGNDGRRTAIGVAGSLALEVAGGRWRARHEHDVADALRVNGNLEGRLNDAAIMDSTIAGLVTVSAADMSRADRLLRGLGLETPDWMTLETGRLSSHIDVAGTFDQPRASGEINLKELRIEGSGPTALDASFVASREAVRVQNVRATLGKNLVEGNAALKWSAKAAILGGAFDVTLADFEAFGHAVTRWHPSGTLIGRIELGGTSTNPSLQSRMSGASIEVAGQAIDQIVVDLSYADDTASISRIQIDQPGGGQLQMTGTYETETGRHALTLNADSFVVSPIADGDDLTPLRATIDGSLKTGGTRRQPSGGGNLALTNLAWGDAHLDRADTDITLSESGVDATMRTPLSLQADARVTLFAPYDLTLTATADDTSVRELVRVLGAELPPTVQQIDGAVSGRIRLAGALEDRTTQVADLDLTQLQLQSDGAVLRLTSPASAHYESSKLTVGRTRLETGKTAIEISGEIARPAALTGLGLVVDGRLEDFNPWLVLAGLPADAVIGGSLNASFLASGSIDATDLTGRMQIAAGTVQWPDYPAATGIAMRMAIENESIDLVDMTAAWQDATVAGTARVPLKLVEKWLPSPLTAGLSKLSAPASLQARLDNLTPAALAPFTGDSLDEDLTGRATLEIDVTADAARLERLTGSILMSEFNATAEGLPIGQDRPTRVNIVGGELQITDWSWSMAGSRISVGGRAQLAGNRALAVNVGGQLDLRVIGALLPDVSTGGIGDLSLALGGTLTAPLADGSIELRDGELNLADPQIGVSGTGGRIFLRPNRVEVTGLEGDVNGGRFSVIGGLEYEGLKITGGSISVDAHGVALAIPEGMRTEIDSTLSLSFANRTRLSGNVAIVRGAYREPLSLAVGFATASRERATASPGPAGEASLFEQLDLSVAVVSTDDLIVDNNYGRMNLGIDVRLVGTAARPAVTGRASIREGGTLFLGGRSYLIERGVIDFTDPRAIVPELDLSARTRVRGPDEGGQGIEYDITLELTGTPDELEVTLSSDPSRSQADIVSLLTTGQLADQAGGLGGAEASEQALALLSGEALGFAAQAIGVDSIRIERDPALDAFAADPSIAAEVNPAQRLTVSRRVANVEVTLSQNLRETGRLTWIVGYSPRRALELRTVARDDRDRSYEIRHDVTFGGAPAAPRRPSSISNAPRVVGVRFSGDARLPTAQLEHALDLQTGDRFDFYRWQEDRSRLRRLYLENRYLEVRISARRIESEGTSGGGVVLEYAIDAGPRTIIELGHYQLPPRVVRELEEIWSDTIISAALMADLREAIRRHLAEDGYLRPEVELSQVRADALEKRVRISILPGSRSASRRVEFSGYAHLPVETLEATAADLGIEAWLAPARLADEIALLYRQEGLLAAKVTAGPIAFTNGDARLPVRIEEGAQFTVSGVVIAGAHARSEREVLEDFGLVEGTPYTPDSVQLARQRVGEAYDQLGFNSMTSTVETTNDPERATVELRLTVNEGPQQTVEAIVVNGRDDVRESVISDALGLSTGSPVVMETLYAGRRRLFRTGLFQRVDIEPVPVDETEVQSGIQPVRAEVTLVRRAPWRLRYGVDITDEIAPLAEQGRLFGAGFSANLDRYGLAGFAGTAGIGMRLNRDQRIYRAFLTLPSFLSRAVTSRLFASRSRDLIEGEEILSVVTDRTAFTAEQRIQVRPTLEIGYGFDFERNHTFDPDANPDDPFGFDLVVQAARLTGTLVFDTRTDPFAPARGLFHSSAVEYAPERLGSDVRFVKYSLQQFLFAPVGRRIVSASAVRLGIGTGFGQRLLVTERFVAGGGHTVRGYANDSIGGFDVLGDPMRGDAVIVLNQEMRFPVFRWFGGAVFVDAGEVFERPAEMSLRLLDVGTGAGLRLATPVGLFRVDLATPVPRRGRSLQWYFAFGHTF